MADDPPIKVPSSAYSEGAGRLPVPNVDVELPAPIVEAFETSTEEIAPGTSEKDRLPPGGSQLVHWRSLSDAILFTLIVVGPTMLWEEMWRGQPMIDQSGDLWVAPAVIAGLAYFIGGSIAGRHRRRPSGAVVQGIALAVPTSIVLIIADVGRRIVLSKGLSLSVVGLWLGAIVATIVIATLGALFGRWAYIRSRRRRKAVHAQ